MNDLILNHPNQAIRDAAPVLNTDVIKADMDSLFKLRFQYRDSESQYDPLLQRAMYAARAPGGATAALKGITGLVNNLSRALNTNSWTEIQIAIYEMQAKILSDLGDPTQITPYAANTNMQAVISLFSELNGGGRYDTLAPGIINYLVGQHGHVPKSVSPSLQQQALKLKNLSEPVEYVPSRDREGVLNSTKQKLRDVGIKNPSNRQAISAHMLRLKESDPDGVAHVVACHKGENTPNLPPELPLYARALTGTVKTAGGKEVKVIQDVINAIGGYGKLEEIAARALHLKQIDDHVYIFPQGEQEFELSWREKNLKKIAEFFDEIPEKLIEAGFYESQLGMVLFNDNLTTCIRDVFDHKSRGLFDYIKQELRQNNTIDLKIEPISKVEKSHEI